MIHTRPYGSVVLLLALATAASSAATELQTTNISAAAFRSHGRSSSDSYRHSTTFLGSDGYLYDGEDDGNSEAVEARLTLPQGVEVWQVCHFTRRTDPEVGHAFLALYRKTLATPGDPAPTYLQILALQNGSAPFGYSMGCSTLGSRGIVQPSADVNEGDGEEFVSWLLHATVAEADGFGGVSIRWRRAVSASTSATFSDVPVGHPLSPFVEALASSGITAGCGGGNYCPNAPVTRAQMAAFFAKSLGLHWPD